MMTNKTVYLKNYKPPVFAVDSVHLTIDLYDDQALVTAELALRRQHSGYLHLFGDGLELLSIALDGQVLPSDQYQLESGDLIIPHCPDQCRLKTVVRIKPQDNTQLSGLYRSNHLFCTQCEAEGFRRISFYPDRPDVLSVFTTRISADKKAYPQLLSNGNCIDAGETGDGRHWALWHDPFKKPSYLFALVAGDLACICDEFITASGRRVDLRIYVEHGNEDKCDHAMASLKRSMRWDEQVYGREYDLDIFMIVAVSDFNMGAMENKGLNIFNSKYILARPETATDQDFADVEGVVAHEYFHNWTGNRVTCRDWFQLSLKEGLTVFRDQEFSRDMNSPDVNRIMDVKALKTTQFPEDAGRMAHPVRPASYQEINNFYTATIYNKGAEVIRMQHTLLGAAGFRKGTDLYFDRHDGQAVTIDDFVAAMEDANGVNLSQFKRWYSQAGTPIVKAECRFQAGELALQLSQNCPPTPDATEKLPFHIPIRMALFAADGRCLHEAVLELKEATQTFRFDRLSEAPIVSLLRDFSAPIKLQLPYTQDQWLDLLRVETNGYAKWDASQRLSTGFMHQLMQEPLAENEQLFAVYARILNDASLDQALRAELLSPPGYEELIADLTAVDVAAVEQARDRYRSLFGQHLFEQAQETYARLWSAEDHDMTPAAYGRRKLRNLCLWLMMKGREQAGLVSCQTQFAQSRTMTDQLASFALLVNASDVQHRAAAIADFYQQWQGDELVMDKWFAIQATSEADNALSQVQQLLSHPRFSLKNPNKVRALIGAFVNANPRHFHAINGSGYAFLTEMLKNLDPINPQIAARLATPFTRWQYLDAPRQALIQAELQQLSRLSLSKDLREMVSKSLD